MTRYDHTYLHQRIALVGQEPVLYARSIRENIIYGLEGKEGGGGATELLSITPSDMNVRLLNAAMEANAHGFITEMTEG